MNSELCQVKHCFLRFDPEDGGHCLAKICFSTDGAQQAPKSVISRSGGKEEGEKKTGMRKE